MLIKEVQYNYCECCGSNNGIKTEAVYGCDECKTPFNDSNRLEVTVFMKADYSIAYSFCSWKCVFANLPTIECDSFITLPLVQFKDGEGDGTAAELFELLKAKENVT